MQARQNLEKNYSSKCLYSTRKKGLISIYKVSTLILIQGDGLSLIKGFYKNLIPNPHIIMKD